MNIIQHGLYFLFYSNVSIQFFVFFLPKARLKDTLQAANQHALIDLTAVTKTERHFKVRNNPETIYERTKS